MRFMQSCPEARATQDGHRGRELNHALRRELFGQAYMPHMPRPERGHQKPGERAALLLRGCSRPSSRIPQVVCQWWAACAARPSRATQQPYPRS